MISIVQKALPVPHHFVAVESAQVSSYLLVLEFGFQFLLVVLFGTSKDFLGVDVLLVFDVAVVLSNSCVEDIRQDFVIIEGQKTVLLQGDNVVDLRKS